MRILLPALALLVLLGSEAPAQSLASAKTDPATLAMAWRVLDEPVRSQEGRTLGTVRDFVVAPGRDAISQVVVETTGIGGPRLVAVPLEYATAPPAGTDGIVLQLSEAELEEMPSFNYPQGVPTLVDRP